MFCEDKRHFIADLFCPARVIANQTGCSWNWALRRLHVKQATYAMKKLFFVALIFGCGLARADGFEGTVKLGAKHGSVVHTLNLSRWHVDTKGMPSFDYVYEQEKGACQFRVAGHADKVLEVVNGKMEPVVFNPEDAMGRALPPVVAYDSDDISFSLPFKGAVNKVGLRSPMPATLRARACDKGDDEGLNLVFTR